MSLINGVYKTRNFVVTQWNINCDYQRMINAGQIRYLAYSEETCPDTNRLHHQMFLTFHNPKSSGLKNCSKIGNMFGDTHCFVSPQRGSWAQNVSYCSKEATLIEFGDKPRQGFRGDLCETKDEIMNGNLNTNDLILADPMMIHQYGRVLDKIQDLYLRKQYRSWMTEGIWIWGPTASGKSHMAFT